jgi:membrane associated rhomboid family serine protease
MAGLSFLTIIIIAANVIITYKGLGDYQFFDRYKFHIGAIKGGDKIRMLSSGFLHVNTLHLFFNMFTLYFFAPEVIAYLGDFRFLIIYGVSLFLGSLLSYYFHKDKYHYTAVGASGAVTGVLYSAILLRPDMSLYFFLIPIPIPAYVFGIGYLLYSIYGMKKSIGNIGHDAHFGGAIGGYLATLVMLPVLLQTNLLMVLLLAVPIGILFFMHKTGKL